MHSAFWEGFGVGGGLIVAIGAQNAFVLTQGVRRNFHYLVAGICFVFDVLFISLGVVGVGAAALARPGLVSWLGWLGSLFLFWCGWRALMSALRGGQLDMAEAGRLTMKGAVVTTLAVTLLNPHVYLDTILFLGGISTQFAGTGRYLFGLGAATASFCWFFSLSFGGQFLAPLFKKPLTWRFLDGFVCLTMWGIAVTMVLRQLMPSLSAH
ncbi:LysE/ArgO family amino acid transporter [Desulfoplanes formicivorans]|uniref:Amino acid transporter n=1 Tax=Desulfoplanes formicivorans TaxID=1592317 RepID=A0A194AH38_9BACT|nr:LysE/ArgO family amino acid transporter [Desulfoplanes formicivorans]GAU08401.1 amino acid transporter [Desulfoplanes formicivorans]